MNAHTRAEALRLVDEMDRAASYIDMPSHCASAVAAYDAATTKLRALLSASDDVPEQRLAAIVKWLEVNQPDVFSRGLWDAINAAPAPNGETK